MAETSLFKTASGDRQGFYGYPISATALWARTKGL